MPRDTTSASGTPVKPSKGLIVFAFDIYPPFGFVFFSYARYLAITLPERVRGRTAVLRDLRHQTARGPKHFELGVHRVNWEFKNRDAVEKYIFLFERIQDVTERVQHAAQGDLFLTHRIQNAAHLAFFPLKEFNMPPKTISFRPIEFKMQPILLSFRRKNSTCRPKRSLSVPSNSRCDPS